MAESPKKQQVLNVHLRKSFSKEESDPPFPVFLNAIDLSQVGLDIFMDGGVIHPETLQNLEKPDENGVAIANMQVVFRATMSLSTLKILQGKVNEILKEDL